MTAGGHEVDSVAARFPHLPPSYRQPVPSGDDCHGRIPAHARSDPGWTPWHSQPCDPDGARVCLWEWLVTLPLACLPMPKVPPSSPPPQALLRVSSAVARCCSCPGPVFQATYLTGAANQAAGLEEYYKAAAMVYFISLIPIFLIFLASFRTSGPTSGAALMIVIALGCLGGGYINGEPNQTILRLVVRSLSPRLSRCSMRPPRSCWQRRDSRCSPSSRCPGSSKVDLDQARLIFTPFRLTIYPRSRDNQCRRKTLAVLLPLNANTPPECCECDLVCMAM